MMSKSEDHLREIQRWVKIIGVQEAKSVLTDILSDEHDDKQDNLRRAFHLTDGSHTRAEIAKRTSYSGGWVSGRHGEWHDLGLIEKIDTEDGGSYRHVITLKEAGIEVPDIPDPEEESED
jgi:hypothetical protein